MKKHTITALFLFLTLGVKAQFNIGYSMGYGTYQMKEMKQLLQQAEGALIQSMPKGIGIVANFPPYITHTVDASYRFKRHELGLKGSYLTTGGKIAYSDYSGKYREKLTLNGIRMGAMYRFYLKENKLGNYALQLFGEISPGITITNLKYKATLDLYQQNIHQEERDILATNGNGLSIQPLIGGRLQMNRHISLTASAGYDFEFGATLFTVHRRADWSGFRLNGGVNCSF